MRKIAVTFALLVFWAISSSAQDPKPLLMQSPSMSKTQIAFAYGGEIWTVDRNGGDAKRLVTGPGIESEPIFSPDGSMVAYTGDYDGNEDVYVVPATGGEPRRLTNHPGSDVAIGWTPDGRNILFRSLRDSYSRFERIFSVSVNGGFPTVLPLPMGVEASFSADASQVAYVPRWNRRLGAAPNYIAIQHYRGGLTSPIWIANLSDSSIVKIPRENSNDFNPMWIGDKIYFLSDREGPVCMFAYDVKTKEVKEVVKNEGFDIKSASAGPGGIVYEKLGSLHVYDLASGKSKEIDVRVAGDLPQVAPHFEKVAEHILNANISPTGQRAVFEAHGEILTVPAEKGDIRNITRSPAIADRDPAWSPDGKSIAYFSDESGEYALHIRNQDGIAPDRKIDLGQPPSFFYSPTWSPDSKKIAYTDKRLNLWYVDLDHPTPVKVDTDRFDSPLHEFDVVWSPDNKWLAYSKQLENHMRAVYVYSLDDKKATQITDGMSDALFPNFDKNGKYLYFTASTDLGLSTGWLDMTSDAHPVSRAVYVVVLRKDLPSPIAPESDDEKAAETKDDKSAAPADQNKDAAKDQAKDQSKDQSKDKAEVKVTIDFDGISQRILALPIPPANYVGMSAGKEGVLYLLEDTPVDFRPGPPQFSIQRFDLKTRKTEKIADGVRAFSLSFNGEKMLYEQGQSWFITAADKPVKPGDGQLKLADMEVYVDPRAEWKQMFHEVWRIERDFFYDPHYHGLDLAAAEKAYEPFLDGVTSRADLDYLFGDMLGYINVQHMFVGGGTMPDIKRIKVGLLGADYTIENGRYRFSRIYNGENWNPELHAPLTQPGVNVKEGEYLLAVNGRDLRGDDEVYSFFQETAGKQTVIKVGPNADGSGSRDVTVVPVDDETALRNLAWIEGNRRNVDELSGGKLAYVYLPDTGGEGFTNFNRYFFAQVGKEGAVIDERFNGGGQLADYFIDYLRRPVFGFVKTREGETASEPEESIFGPKAMLINEFAGSGGDALPWYFRKADIGPLIGMRTWGGLVGIGGYPALIDGGRVTAPRWAIYGTKGQWEVENHGVDPDVEIDLDPKLVREGHDPQLEKAVQVLMESLKDHPLPTYPAPQPFNYHPKF
ncbi:MAG TPA: PDZ domain-containing protein [Candidatus Acidoferrales bacterium]|nr:PDZ domain-containing protein [Candidatus Acidoferrales bacterium]